MASPQAAALADDHTRQVAERLGGAIDASTRLALISALSDAAGTISAELAPASVEVRMVGQDPEFVVSVPTAESEPTLLVPEPFADPTRRATSRIEADDEPIARISLRLPQSVKVRVDEKAAAEQISTNAWLIRAVMDALAEPGSADGRDPDPGPRCPARIFGPDGPFGPHGVFGPHGPFGSSPTAASARPSANATGGTRPGLGTVSRTSTHDGVRRVVRGQFRQRLDHRRARRAAGRRRVLDRRRRRELPAIGARPPGARRAADQRPASGVPHTDAHLRLGAPPGLEYVIKVGSAEVSVGTDIGRSKITSGSGDISVGRATDLECSTGSGDISVGSVAASGTRLESGSGAVSVGEVRCPGPGQVRVR